MTMADTLRDTLYALEIQVWDALVSGDGNADGALLTEDFLGVYPDGFAGKDAHVQQLDHGASVADYRLSAVQIRQTGPNSALLIYRADYLRTGSASWEAMLISSLWENRANRWLNSFSQDTPLIGEGVP
ncbi:MAG: nuclear transport factor 2 family protein [Shimia sp.]